MSFEKIVDRLLHLFNQQDATKDEIIAIANEYIKAAKAINNAHSIEESMLKIAQLFITQDVAYSSLASNLCGFMVEQGYDAKRIYSIYTEFYLEILERAIPFMEYCATQLENLKEDEDEYEKLDELVKAHPSEYEDGVLAYHQLENYYTIGIAIYSSQQDYFKFGKETLHKVHLYRELNNGCHWFATLFDTLFNEPIVVIDIDHQIGFEGIMNGVVNNFQLQFLLMGIDDINKDKMLTQEQLSVVNGTGPQNLPSPATLKWNMYNWQYIQNKDTAENNFSSTNYWIWGEGIPSHITCFDNKRIILLGEPSYERSTSMQRTFSPLKASIEVTKLLSSSEIDIWLDLFLNREIN